VSGTRPAPQFTAPESHDGPPTDTKREAGRHTSYDASQLSQEAASTTPEFTDFQRGKDNWESG
jgi:hypothetical protein